MYLFIFGCAEFIAVCRLSLVAGGLGVGVGGWGYSLAGVFPFHCGSSVAWALGDVGSAVLVQGLHCFKACGLFLDQGSHPHPLHWQADSLPLSH